MAEERDQGSLGGGGGDFQVGQKAPEGLWFLKAVSEEWISQTGVILSLFSSLFIWDL